tara:strand:- start:144 stop:698 length:555 start_codon:yes stop_codon:yes gene_type:complete
MRFFFWLCFVFYWSFLILAPLNAFAADKTFTCKPVVAGSPKKDGSFYVEDIDDESTPMLDVIPIFQLLVRGGDVYLKNNPSRKFEALVPYEEVADIKEIREIHEGLNNWDEILSLDNFRTFYLRYFNNGTESLKRISINARNTKTAVLTVPMEDHPSYFSLSNCQGDSTNKNIQIEYDRSKRVS